MSFAVVCGEAPHHNFFVHSLLQHYNQKFLVCIERGKIQASFDTHHPFEEERNKFEQIDFGPFYTDEYRNKCRIVECENINCSQVITAFQKEKPKIVFVMGTRQLHPEILHTGPLFLNFHGGDPEHYRGLDSHLWVIYHKEFLHLVVTLHRLDEALDTGDIVDRRKIEIFPNMKIAQLRSVNVKICVEMAICLLDTFFHNNSIQFVKQIGRGRYYSFMPTSLKEIVVRNFNNYVTTLSG